MGNKNLFIKRFRTEVPTTDVSEQRIKMSDYVIVLIEYKNPFYAISRIDGNDEIVTQVYMMKRDGKLTAIGNNLYLLDLLE